MGGERLRVTILMPTFNDAEFITFAIKSVLEQDYDDWELLIFDDASTDNTREVVDSFARDPRIRYFRGEQNQDQLNALYQLLPYVTGDVVTLLHSDDMFSDNKTISRIVSHFRDGELDGIYADLYLIDSFGKRRGLLRTPDNISERVVRQAFLAMGSNLVTDVFCVKRETFFQSVVRNYILWNTFYWLRFTGGDRLSLLRLLKVDPWYCYRIGDNYLSKQATEARRAFVLSGCYRTLTELSYYYSIGRASLLVLSLPKLRRLALSLPSAFVSCVAHSSCESLFAALKRNSHLLERLLNAYKIKHPTLQAFFKAPIEYMRNSDKSNVVVDVDILDYDKEEKLLFFGKDARRFFEETILGQDVPARMHLLLARVHRAKAVRVYGEKDAKLLRDVLRFFCIPIPILVGNETDREDDLLKGFSRRFEWDDEIH